MQIDAKPQRVSFLSVVCPVRTQTTPTFAQNSDRGPTLTGPRLTKNPTPSLPTQAQSGRGTSFTPTPCFTDPVKQPNQVKRSPGSGEPHAPPRTHRTLTGPPPSTKRVPVTKTIPRSGPKVLPSVPIALPQPPPQKGTTEHLPRPPSASRFPQEILSAKSCATASQPDEFRPTTTFLHFQRLTKKPELSEQIHFFAQHFRSKC